MKQKVIKTYYKYTIHQINQYFIIWYKSTQYYSFILINVFNIYILNDKYVFNKNNYDVYIIWNKFYLITDYLIIFSFSLHHNIT